MKFSQTVEYQKKRGFTKLFITNLPEFLEESENYYIQKELHSIGNETGDNGKLSRAENHLQKIFTLFYHLWFRNKLTEEEIDFFRSFIQMNSFPYYEKALLVTGLTLSLVRYFDENKIILLFECYDSEEAEINQRALIGLLIGLYHYDQRMPFFHA